MYLTITFISSGSRSVCSLRSERPQEHRGFDDAKRMGSTILSVRKVREMGVDAVSKLVFPDRKKKKKLIAVSYLYSSITIRLQRVRRQVGKLWTAVYPSRMAPIGAKLCQNAFQTIPDVSFFDAKKFFRRNFWIENFVFCQFGVVFAELRIFGRQNQLPRQILL